MGKILYIFLRIMYEQYFLLTWRLPALLVLLLKPPEDDLFAAGSSQFGVVKPLWAGVAPKAMLPSGAEPKVPTFAAPIPNAGGFTELPPNPDEEPKALFVPDDMLPNLLADGEPNEDPITDEPNGGATGAFVAAGATDPKLPNDGSACTALLWLFCCAVDSPNVGVDVAEPTVWPNVAGAGDVVSNVNERSATILLLKKLDDAVFVGAIAAEGMAARSPNVDVFVGSLPVSVFVVEEEPKTKGAAVLFVREGGAADAIVLLLNDWFVGVAVAVMPKDPKVALSSDFAENEKPPFLSSCLGLAPKINFAAAGAETSSLVTVAAVASGALPNENVEVIP